MRYPLFLCMLVSVLLISSCENNKPSPDNPDNPPNKKELWSRDKIVRYESKSNSSDRLEAYTYDSQGREASYILYIDKKVYMEYRNYSYDGFMCTYDGYVNGVNGYRATIEFYDESWNRGKLRHETYYYSDTEHTYKTEYQYNDQGKLIGEKSYDGNTLLYEHKNYLYDENRWSYDIYHSSSFMATSIIEYTYNDAETIKKKYTVNDPSSYEEWCYDNEGREISLKEYKNSRFTYEYKNYIYNEKVCTYDIYSNGILSHTVLLEYY